MFIAIKIYISGVCILKKNIKKEKEKLLILRWRFLEIIIIIINLHTNEIETELKPINYLLPSGIK